MLLGIVFIKIFGFMLTASAVRTTHVEEYGAVGDREGYGSYHIIYNKYLRDRARFE